MKQSHRLLSNAPDQRRHAKAEELDEPVFEANLATLRSLTGQDHFAWPVRGATSRCGYKMDPPHRGGPTPPSRDLLATVRGSRRFWRPYGWQDGLPDLSGLRRLLWPYEEFGAPRESQCTRLSLRFGFVITSIFFRTSTFTGTTPDLIMPMRSAAALLRSMMRPRT